MISSIFISKALQLPCFKEVAFESLNTDSRKIKPGDLFVALKGEFFDGHDFIEAAIDSGAKGILCKQGFLLKATKKTAEKAKAVLCFEVPDPLTAFRTIAHHWRKQFDIPTVVVAGSVGKTTTKELLCALLSGKYEAILKTKNSENGFIGIPMTLLELRAHHRIAVIEVGIDEPGAMIQHLSLIEPTHSVLTAIGPEHLEKLKNMETVASEEILAVTEVSKKGKTAFCLDDPEIEKKMAKVTLSPNRSLGYTFNKASSDQCLKGTLVGSHCIEISGGGFPDLMLPLPLPGLHNARNLLGAIAVARLVGIKNEELTIGLERFTPAPGRSEVYFLCGPLTVVCDYYNANPSSMEAAFQTLIQLDPPKTASRRILCLGDMLELGEHEVQYHEALALPLLQTVNASRDIVLLYGSRMKALAQALKQAGYLGKVEHFDSHAPMLESLLRQIQPHALILIKGSRGMKMETLWKGLLKTYPLQGDGKSYSNPNPKSH